MCTRGSLDERGADVALAGQQRHRVGRHAGLAQRPEDHQRAARRLLGRLEHDGVAGGEAGADHPERDREREVPRRDHRDDAARARSSSCCARPGPAAAGRPGRCPARRGRSTRGSRSPRRRRRRPPATASRTRARPARRPPAGARAATARRAPAPRRARWRASRPTPARRAARPAAPRRRRPRSPWPPCATTRSGLAGVGRDELLALALVAADPHRHLQRRPRVVLARSPRPAAPARARGAARGSARWRTASCR